MRRPLVVVAAAALLLWPAGPAAAHTSLLDGSPGPGDEVAVGTEVVALELDGVQVDGAHVVAVERVDDGEALPVGDAVAVGATTVCALVEPLQAGVHAVEYEVVSDDGHPVQGRYLFEVVDGAERPTERAGCAAAELPAPDEARSLGLEVADLPGWVLPVVGSVLVVSAAAAVVAVVRSRRDDT